MIFKELIYDKISKEGLINFGITLSIIIIAMIIIALFSVKFYKKLKIKCKIQEKKHDEIRKEYVKIEEILEEYLDTKDSEQLKAFIKKLKGLEIIPQSQDYKEEIKEKLKDVKSQLRIRIEEEKLNKINQRKHELKDNIDELENIKFQKEREVETKDQIILDRLNLFENNIFLAENLNEKEIESLSRTEEFVKISEYDPITNENMTFFVKKILNHSPTHTLLVERIKALLLQYFDYPDVRMHWTRDADITFKVNRRYYAFEIETGNLLKKKDQMKKKVNDLNKKYKDRWYFIVSNKNLLSKYKKFGKSAPRSGVREIIEKIANF